jgi:1-acyl-sn-glycerol-3-phosphate acyltransferase
VSDADLARIEDIPNFSRMRVILRLALYIPCNIVLVPTFLIAAIIHLPWARAIQRFWADMTMWILGFDLSIIGEPRLEKPTLFAANHVSYFDIAVFLRALRGTFVAKAEISGWPLFGIVGRLTKTVFVKRDRAEARRQRDDLTQRLLTGENLIFFPEGTSTDGGRVMPFKSTLFGAAQNPALHGAVAVQPVSICYANTRGGVPLTGPLRGLYAWFGEATMVPHFYRALGAEGVRVEVRFAPPIAVDADSDRKVLAAQAYNAVKDGVARSKGELPDGDPSSSKAAEIEAA